MRLALALVAAMTLTVAGGGLPRDIPASAAGRCLGRAVTITGTDGSDNLKGTPGDDVIDGRAGNDTIDGKGGVDVICGGPGNDVIVLAVTGTSGVADAGLPSWHSFDGGAGDDRLDLSSSSDLDVLLRKRLSGQPDIEVRTGGTLVARVDVSTLEILATGDGNDRIRDAGQREVAGFFGGAGNDRLTGSSDREVIDGGQGHDIVAAGAGPDVIDSGPGNDVYDGGPGADVITFNASRSPIVANLATGSATGDGRDRLSAIESIIGGPRNDKLTGDGGRNTIDGGNGNDTIDGGAGNDGLFGGNGDDIITDPDGKNKIEGNDGNDALNGGAGNDFIEGGDGDDHIAGGIVAGQGIDRLYGYKKGPPAAVFASDDDVIAGSGAFVDGGPGNDDISNQIGAGTTYGGPGDDIIKAQGYMDGGAGNDIVEDRGGLFDSVLRGGPGSDLLLPEEGDDRVSGGPGRDEVDYSDVKGFDKQVVDLQTGTATGDAVGNDRLTSIEDVTGAFATEMEVTGNRKNNRITLAPGYGRAVGGPGDDILLGGTAPDTLIGGDGFDSADGDGGLDDCDAEVEVNCEGNPPND